MNFNSVARTDTPLKFNENLQYIRAFAAMSVMLYHAAHYVHAHLGAGLYDVFHHFLGLYGVAIFFALSGYLMVELSSRQNAHAFLAARIIRIYPALLIATLFALISDPFRLIEKFNWVSITLVPAGPIFYVLNVEWTLVHEMFFYLLVFGFISLNLRKFLPLFAACWIALLLARYGAPMPRIGRANIAEMFFMTANAGFAAGLIVPVILSRIPRTPMLMIAGFCLSIPLTFFVPAYFARITSGVGSAFLIVAALQTTAPVFRGASARALKSLGDWSYAMYLIHVPVILLVVRHLPSFKWPEITYFLCVGAATLASVVLGRADIKIHQVTRNILKRTPTVTLNAGVNLFVIAYILISMIIFF
ncbi:hypothetical protein BRY73_19975 [Ochrobactrum sp. P6BS-III]|uniref:acyltransferase family protein n=1 Tax=unclassified Ochrobactrum TaxID=239106 RepID=UPI000993BD7C|nr:peptidoglycan/LPS O-acetylase OafA/YrhL [Ochrobactrum sp. P6BSIII]OOL15229.1 hypothetical protein BRY73_19975 [Ochrobactrum sp. P6BS-III]